FQFQIQFRAAPGRNAGPDIAGKRKKASTGFLPNPADASQHFCQGTRLVVAAIDSALDTSLGARNTVLRMARVVIENVSKIFKGPRGEAIHAVKDASLIVEDKEFLVLVGPSGCGKSTVLRLIAGLEEISRGRISIDGQVVNDMEPKDRDIAMVFQNYALYPHMTVYENMAF